MFIVNLYAHISLNGTTHFTYSDPAITYGEEEGFSIHISPMMLGKLKDREALKQVKDKISMSPIDWINTDRKEWVVDFNKAKQKISALNKLPWLSGKIHVHPVVEVEEHNEFDEITFETDVKLEFFKDEISYMQNNKIFLSHKGKNKPLVRKYNKVLTQLGFNTWLDENAMNAGSLLDRALHEGMASSCAAIFFVTPDYQDEGYLANEIDYAVSEKRNKGDQFQIITIILEDEKGNKGEVPALLQRFVWKKCENDLDALHEILKSLPVAVGEIRWQA